ncbi:MAG: TIGR03435 family protein [Acidobacteriia bacterium]|nr:TIGR03435 family protein [Terriglobia bacterium]
MLKILPRITGVVLVLAAPAAFGQTPAAPLAFEVASIKPSPPLDPTRIASGQPIHAGMKIDAARVDIGNFSVTALILKAYDVKLYQISGPDWVTSMGAQMNAQRFDILAKMPEGTTKEQVPEMLRTLLAERFKLAVHRDTKEHAVYALVVGKGGPKLKESEPDPIAPAVSADGGPAPPPSTGSNQVTVNATGKGAEVSDGQGGKQRMSMSPDGKSMHLENSKVSMAQFADMITPFVDRPVVDMTELKGNYRVALDISMEEVMAIARKAGMAVPGMGGGGDAGRAPAEAASDPSGSSIFATVQQLGLKLEARKAPITQIVIDHVEKMPTEN